MSNDDDGAQKPKDVRLVASPGSFSLLRARRPDYKWNMNENALALSRSQDNKILSIMSG